MEFEIKNGKKEACTLGPKIFQPNFAIGSNKTNEGLENWVKVKDHKIEKRKDIDKDMKE